MAARVHEIGRYESCAAAHSILLIHGAVSLGEESSTFGRMAVPSSWWSSPSFTLEKDVSGS